MNLTNAVYRILTDYQDAAPAESHLSAALIASDIYTDIAKTGTTVRISDVFGSELAPGGVSIKELNAGLDIQIYSVPTGNTLDARVEAREEAENTAQEIAKVLYEARDLKGICTIGRIFKRNDWVKPGSVRMPAVLLRVAINER